MTRVRTLLLAGVCLAVPACGSPPAATGPAHVKVTGKVTAGSKPVSGALVQFIPSDASGQATTGRTGPGGEFTLMSADGATGAAPGKYKVTLSRLVGKDGKELPPDVSPFTGDGRESVPPAYTSLEQTPLTATVPADKAELTIDLPIKGSLTN